MWDDLSNLTVEGPNSFTVKNVAAYTTDHFASRRDRNQKDTCYAAACTESWLTQRLNQHSTQLGRKLVWHLREEMRTRKLQGYRNQKKKARDGGCHEPMEASGEPSGPTLSFCSREGCSVCLLAASFRQLVDSPRYGRQTWTQFRTQTLRNYPKHGDTRRACKRLPFGEMPDM